MGRILVLPTDVRPDLKEFLVQTLASFYMLLMTLTPAH